MTIDEARQVEEFVEGEGRPAPGAGGAGDEENDRQYERFLKAIEPAPAQCLRYAFYDGAEPLWPRADARAAPADVPPCEHCGCRRRFEFQILPQLLHYLRLEGDADVVGVEDAGGGGRGGAGHAGDRAAALDWGTIAVYSCRNSCSPPDGGGERSGYVREFVWVQPPI